MSGAQTVAAALSGEPKNWYSWDYELRDEAALVAALKLEWISDRGTLTIAGRTWELGREGWCSGAYFLKQSGRVLASAEKPSVLFRAFVIKIDGAFYRWQAESAFTRSFLLFDGDRIIGSMRPASVFKRNATIELPEELSIVRKAFLVWLALLMWRRQQNSS